MPFTQEELLMEAVSYGSLAAAEASFGMTRDSEKSRRTADMLRYAATVQAEHTRLTAIVSSVQALPGQIRLRIERMSDDNAVEQARMAAEDNTGTAQYLRGYVGAVQLGIAALHAVLVKLRAALSTPQQKDSPFNCDHPQPITQLSDAEIKMLIDDDDYALGATPQQDSTQKDDQ